MSESTTAAKRPHIRRVVTGHTADGVARVLEDGPAMNAKFAASGNVSTLIWSSDQCPADIAIGEEFEDYGARKLGSQPPEHGSRFAVIEFPPGSMGGLHRTESLDYIIVISGTIEMALDDSTVTLNAGDVMVQRGTNHAWNNTSDKPARVAFVLLDGKPLGIGNALKAGHSAQ